VSIQTERRWAMEPGHLAGLFRAMKAKGLPDVATVAAMASGSDREDALYDRLGPLAVVRLSGPMSKDGNLWWGITSMREVGAGLLQAGQDATVSGIFLDVDTAPGGTVAGIEELAGIARMVAAQKPLYVYASDLLASAAYWVASQAKEIATHETAEIGSIGVVLTHTDWSGWNEQMGVDVSYITAGKYKAMGNPDEPLSEEARAYLQQQLDAVYDLFLDAVAEGRRVSREQALAMADGKVFLGRQALELGLVDRLESRADFINRIVQEVHMDLKTFKAEHAGVAAEHRAEVATELSAKADQDRQAAVAAERDRCLGVVTALVGKELGDKVAGVVAAGVTAEQAQAMGAFMAAPAAAPDKDEPSRAQKDALAALKAATEKPLNPAADAAAKAPDFETLVAAAEETGLSKGKAMAKVIKEHPKAHAAWLAKQNGKEGK